MRLVGWGLAALLVGTVSIALATTRGGSLVPCDGEICGGLETSPYSYPIQSTGFPMVEFRVGTNDLDRLAYRDVKSPPGWSFALVEGGLAQADESCTEHGLVSPGPEAAPTAGCVRWWTEDPARAVESFTFGFAHRGQPGDVGWELVTRRDTVPPTLFTFRESWTDPVGGGTGPLHGPATHPHESLELAAETLVCTTDGLPIKVDIYSVPTFAFWDGDDLPDLIVGEGGGTFVGMVRVYPNIGSVCRPMFQDWFYAQAGGVDLTVPQSGCMGCFPRVVHWDDDGRKDLLLGRSDGRVMLFRNVNTDEAPAFDSGTYLQVGPSGAKVDIDVGNRATSTIADWDHDGRKDLVVGGYDGKIRVFLNEGTHFAPDFVSELIVTQPGGNDLEVPSARACPTVRDLDGDGIFDILAGNTNGQLLLYPGPDFATYTQVEADGVPIDLAGTPRSRQDVCYWRDDPAPDVLVGAGDGLVHLFEGGLHELILDIAPRAAAAGETVEFTTHHGTPDQIALLFLTELNGIPTFQLMGAGLFGADYRWTWSTTVPPGLSGTTATFQAGGYALGGDPVPSNEAILVFR